MTTEFISVNSTKEKIEYAFNNRCPFSIIRLGDGEGMFLGGDFEELYSHSDRETTLRNWFGNIQFDQNFLDHLTKITHDAILNSDILALPSEDEPSSAWANVIPALSRNKLLTRQLIAPFFQIHDMLLNGGLNHILSTTKFVGLVTCRTNILEKFQAKYKIETVKCYEIPEEQTHAALSIRLPHFPHRYEELLRLIEVPFKGAPFLVGGGILGKVYCSHIKNLGGIAIDIGSIFDVWAGISNRSYIDAELKKKYSLVENQRELLNRAIHNYFLNPHAGEISNISQILDKLNLKNISNLILALYADTNDNDYLSLHKTAIHYFNLGNYQNSIMFARKAALATNFSNVYVLHQLSLSYLKNNQKIEAGRVCNLALNIEPKESLVALMNMIRN
jgi:hypothetical protein